MPLISSKNLQRVKRHARLRKKVIGTAERPRLQIHRTLHHIYAAVIDDARGHTLVSRLDARKRARVELESRTNLDAARARSAKRSGAKRKLPALTPSCSTRAASNTTAASPRLAEAARAAGLEF